MTKESVLVWGEILIFEGKVVLMSATNSQIVLRKKEEGRKEQKKKLTLGESR